MSANSIDSASYVDGSIDNAHIADDAIDSEHYADGSIDNAHIADDQIDSEHYAAASIDNEHLADNAVDTAEIADNAVSLAKMAGLARGKIIYGDSSGNPAALTVGSNTQVLKSDGTDISWGTDSGGAALTGSTNNQVTTVTGADAIQGETNFIYDGTIVGAGADGANADLGVGLHIKTSDSGATAASGSDEFIIENGNSGVGVGMAILSATDGYGRIYFGDSGDNDIGQIMYDHTDDGMKFKTNATATSLIIDSTGAVTKPLQPAFLACSSSSQELTNAANETIVCGSVVTDRNNDFDGTTFTAPVTGLYQFSAQVVMDAGGSSDTRFSEARIKFFASNRQAHIYHGDLETNADDRAGMNASVLMDMDANDTVYLVGFFSRYGSSGATDTIVDATSMYTFFSGHLVC
jgi:hypothetical protein